MPQLRTGRNLVGVPVEYYGLLWFASLAVVAAKSRNASLPGLSVLLIFFSSASLAGISSAINWNQQFGNWALNAANFAAFAILLAVSLEKFPSGATVLNTVSGWRSIEIRSGPIRRTLGIVCLAFLSTVAFRSALLQIPRAEAMKRNFLNWYTSRPRSSDMHLNQNGRVRIVAFTDYQCPFSASRIPKVEQVVRELAESSPVPVELVIHDFPIDAACNSAYWGSLHPTACLAASAVRFVTQTLGKEGGAELSAWLYERSNRLTPELIADYLASRGIADGFRGALPVVQRLVAQDAEYGIRLGVSGTPSLFVNGVELPNVTYLRTAIVFEVERQHPRSTSNKQPAR